MHLSLKAECVSAGRRNETAVQASTLAVCPDRATLLKLAGEM
jgi:hypothetical protein